jgi:superfamily I DNA/RNA helicase
MTFESAAQEIDAVAQWIKKQIESGVAPHEIGVFVRSPAEIERAERAVTQAGQPFKVLDARVGTTSGMLSIGSMHLAKGLEFKSVAVMACDDEILPLQQRIQDVGDDSDLKEVYDTERHLLYVACTRARENLLVASVVPASEFLDDLSRAR